MKAEYLKDQLSFAPRLEGGLADFDNLIVGAVGGSALAAKAIFYLDPAYPIWLHDDFGFPEKTSNSPLFVAISYSGNTVEVLNFAEKVLDKDLPLAIIASDGKLLEIARGRGVPYVAVPSGLEPRDAVILLLRALVKIAGKDNLLSELEKIADGFDRNQEEYVSSELLDKVALIYSSRENAVLSYIWKIILNETAKVPAFCNYFPELAHNELQGIAGGSDKFKILLLRDVDDGIGIRLEMDIFEEIVNKQGFNPSIIELKGNRAEKLVKTLAMAKVAGLRLAELRKVEPNATPLIEEFKKEISRK